MSTNLVISKTIQLYTQSTPTARQAADAISSKSNQQSLRLRMDRLNSQDDALKQEEVKVKEQLKDNEEKRLAVNKRLDRPGQLVDKLA
jgi:stress response protein YsnF